MKVLFIAPGNSVHTARWIFQCQSQGIQTFLYSTSDFSQVQSNRDLTLVNEVVSSETLSFVSSKKLFKYITNNKIFEILNIFRHLAEIRKAVKNYNIDLVHIHWLFHSAAFAATFLPGLKIVATPWGSDVQWNLKGTTPSTRQRVIRKVMVSRVIRKSTRFSCDANHLKNRLVSLGAKPEVVEIIYFGVDVDFFSNKNYSEAFRSSIGLKQDEFMVLSNRGLEPVYDIETFIRAAAIAVRRDSRLMFCVASSGSQREALENLVVELDISGRVKFLGRLTNEEFPVVTASADIYVSTSTSDGGLAASVAEAMASEVPVLNTDFGENSMWLESSSAGYTFPIGDHFKLADLILDLASDSLKRSKLGEKGRSIIINKNNSIMESKKIVDLYQTTIGGE